MIFFVSFSKTIISFLEENDRFYNDTLILNF